MTYKELSNIITKPFMSVSDVMKLTGCGRNSALSMCHLIENIIKKDGKILPKGSKLMVPTKMVLEYLNLDVDYIIMMSKI